MMSNGRAGPSSDESLARSLACCSSRLKRPNIFSWGCFVDLALQRDAMSANVCCGVRAAWRRRVAESGWDFGNLEVCKLRRMLRSTSDLDQSLALGDEQSYSGLLLRRECLECAPKSKSDSLTSPVDTPVLSRNLLKWRVRG